MTAMQWQTLKSHILHKDGRQCVRLDTFQTPSGTTGSYIVVDKHNIAVLIARSHENKIALVSIYRYPIKKIIWQLPIETIEKGEDEMSAAQRGVKEEVQVWAEKIEKLGEFYTSPGTLQQKASVFLLDNLEPLRDLSNPDHLEKEMILEIGWFNDDEIEQMITQHSIEDAPTLSALMFFKSYRQQNDLHDDL